MSPVMPVETLIHTAREARDLVKQTLEEASSLELGYIGVDDEERLPHYPAVVVSAGGRSKELHASHTFNVTLRVLIWVYHADLNVGHRQRSDEDLMLVEAIEAALEYDTTFSNRVIFGFVEDTQPGFHQPRSQKSSLVVGTRMMWQGLTQVRF